jgi:hypothetical protein
MPTPFEVYVAKIGADVKGDQATEHTYRPALEQYMEAVRPGVKASNDPKHIECGAPDLSRTGATNGSYGDLNLRNE